MEVMANRKKERAESFRRKEDTHKTTQNKRIIVIRRESYA